MINLELGNPEAAINYLQHVSEASVGLELPSGIFLPDRYKGHPALELPYEVASKDDEKLSGDGRFPMWGGMVSYDDFANSVFYVSDTASEEVRPHIAAALSLITYGESSRVVRAIIQEAYKNDPELATSIGRALLDASRALESLYCGASTRIQQEFYRETGGTIKGHLEAVRSQGGEALFVGQQIGGVFEVVHKRKKHESHVLDAEIPLGGSKTRHIGRPYALNLGDRIIGAGVAREPDRPFKPHTCAGCHLHIAPKSLRVTVEVEKLNRRFDHHHFHIGCA